MRWPNLLRKDLDHGKGRTITKLRGGGGFDWGILGLHEVFSRFVFFSFKNISCPCTMSFRPVHEYVLGLFGVLGFFFHLIIPRANQYFFVFRPTPPFSSAANKLAKRYHGRPWRVDS